MFNRTLQVKLAKPTKVDNPDSPAARPLEDYVQIAQQSYKELAKGAALIVASYVVLDTLRQISVNAAPKR